MTQSSVDYQRDFTDITKEALIQVLHVDDDASFLKAAKPILEMQGNFRVETASSVEEATEILEKKSFDVIVSDYVMPGKTGLDFLKELRDSGDNIPFIIFTGKGREEVAIQALNLGADHYINKIGKTETVYYELAHGILQAVEIARASAGIWKREQRLSAIFASSPDAIIVSDLQANIVDCNEAAWRLSGYSSEEEMLGKSAFELIAEKDRKRALENLEKTLEQGTTRNTEYILLKKNGEEFIGELSASLIKEPSGNPTGFVAVVRDITERKKAEEELKKFKVIIETANYGVGLVDVKTDNLVYTNNELNNMLGYNAGELTGRNYTTLHSKEQMKNAARIRETFFKKGKVQGEELEYKRKDNSTFCGMIVVNPVTDEKGEPIFAAVNVIDITERKKTEENLRRSEKRFRVAVENSPDFLVFVKRDGSIFDVNRFVKGYSKETVIGQSIFDENWYETKDQAKTAREQINHVFRTGKSSSFEYAQTAPDGSLTFYETRIAPFEHDTKGSVTSVQCDTRDITERKRAEEKLIESEKLAKTLLNATTDAAYLIDEDGTIIELNEAMAEKLKATRRELIGKCVFDLFPPEEAKCKKGTLDHVLHLNRPERIEDKGHGMWFDSSIYPIATSSGEKRKVAIFAHDITDRKKTEQILKESEEKYRALVERAADGIAIIQGKFLKFANERLAEMLGYKVEELTDSEFIGLIPPENRERLMDRYKRRQAGEDVPSVYETPILKRIGEEIEVELNLGIIQYEGKPATIAVVRDITERKKAEEALNESERRYRKLFKSTKDGIIVSGPDGKIMSVNSAAAEMLGYEEPEELLGTPVVQFYKESKQRKKLFEKLKKNGYLKDFEVVGRRKDGSAFTSIGTFTLHRDEEGNILRTEGIFRDVTQHKHAEESVRESEEKYRSIVELAPDGIITVSTRGVVTSVNSAFSKLTGFAEDELVGKHFTKLGTVRMREIPKYIRIFTTILRGKISSPVDFSYHRKDGTLGWAEAQAGLLKSRGKTVGVQAIVRDITERKKADVKLEEVNEKLGVVGELTRHDARNKLSTVKMNTFLMKQRLVDDPEALKHLNEIESACKQVERIFDFAKVYEKIGMEELAYMNVEKTLVEAVMLFPDLQAMKVVNDCKGLTVLADSLLRQLFYNLIDNSLKHGEKINQIRLYCKEAGKDQLKLVYGDDGAGIPKAEKKKIFKEGYGKGTGYGLYLISKMCDVYGWTIRETGKQGKGAHFTITIPKSGQDGRENFRIK